MKVQKLGLVLGMNMAVACMVMQGCKATRPVNPATEEGLTVATEPATPAEPTAKADKTSESHKIFAKNGRTRTSVATQPAPEVVAEPATPVDAPKASAISVAPVQPKPAPVVKPAAPVPPQPSKVASVKPLPPPGKPGVKPIAPVAYKPIASKPGAPVADAPAVASTIYVVKSGETLLGICNRQHVKYSALLAANPGIKPNKIRIGQKLNLPAATATVAKSTKAPAAKADKTIALASAPVADATAPTATSKTAPGKVAATAVAANTKSPVKKNAYAPYTGATKKYTVKNGDSLGKIAHENGITIRALKELNGLKKDALRIGQELQIPAEKVVKAEAKKDAAKPVEAKKEEVKKEEVKPAEVKNDAAKPTEAKKEEVKPVEVKKEAVTPAPTPVADVKPAATTNAVPAQKVETPAEQVPDQVAAPAPEASSTYTVKDGDDIVSVAINFDLSPSKLMSMNGLKSGDAIKPGQILKIPAGAKREGL